MNEFDIIEHYFRRRSGAGQGVISGIGDDAAVLELPAGDVLTVSMDTLVSGVHFFPDTSAFDIGYKAMAVNLSDLAAMGARPLWVMLSLTMPEDNPSWMERFCEGFFTLADKHGVSLIGGDLSRGPLSITVEIMGSLKPGSELRRSGASPGDRVYVSGYLGMSAFALNLLKDKENDQVIPPENCLERLNRPIPRVSLGMLLRNVASSAIDISDGLAADLGHIVSDSNTGAEIRLERLPVIDSMKGLDPEEILEYCLHGGDDYELCFTVPQENEPLLTSLSPSLDCFITCIGTIIRGQGIRWLNPSGKSVEIKSTGYRHF